MVRGPCSCCNDAELNRGPWSPEEDALLMSYIQKHGEKGNWRKLPKAAGLQRCGKSCRLRWLNYLRPDIKRGNFSEDESDLIIRLHALLGNRWSIIAGRIPGRSDNEIKNYWNFHLSKKLLGMGIDPKNHKPLKQLNTDSFPSSSPNEKLYSLRPSYSSSTSSFSNSSTSDTSESLDSTDYFEDIRPIMNPCYTYLPSLIQTQQADNDKLSSLDFLEGPILEPHDLLEVLDFL